MKKLYVLLILFWGSNVSLISQTQLSYFENQVPTSKYQNRGIEYVGGSNYLIETNDNSLRVSIIKDSVHLLYEVNDYPMDDPIHYSHGNLNSRSGYETDSVFLYEIFNSQIRKRNLLTSEILESYSISNEDLKNISNMEVVDNIIHFEKNYQYSFATYNISTKEFTNLSYLKRNTQRSNHLYISYSEIFNQLVEYNAENGIIKWLFEDELNTFYGNNNWLAGQKGLIFSTFNSSLRFINADTTFLLNCQFQLVVQDLIIHETANHYVTMTYDDAESTIQLLDKSDCTVQQNFTYPKFSSDSYIKIFSTPSIEDDYLLFALNYGSFESAHLMLLDKKDSSISIIDKNYIQYINSNNFFSNGDEIFFMGHDASEPFPPHYLYTINLKTKEFKADQTGFCYGRPHSFGPSLNDSTYLLSGSQVTPLCIHNFKNKEDSELIHVSSDTRNAGLISPIYIGINEEKMAFSFKNEIFLVDNNAIPGDEIKSIFQASHISNLLINDEVLEGLVNNINTTYHFKYNFDSNSTTYTALEEYTPYISNAIAFSKYIIGTFSTFEKKYFDTELEDFRSIPISDEIVSIHKSNQHILFLTSNDSGYSLTSFINDDFVNSEYSFLDNPKIISKNNGQFFIIENSATVMKQISVINNDGSLGDKMSINGFFLNYNQSGIESGPLSAFMIHNYSDNLEIILHEYGKFHRFSIPYDHVDSYPIIWYKVGNSIILKSEDTNEPGIYICTIGKEPKKIELNDVGFTNYDLLFATHSNGIISFMVDSYPYNLEIVQYNIETGNISKQDSGVDDLRYNWDFINTSFHISQSLYYTTFVNQPQFEEYENGEFYIFDTQNLTFEPAPDLNQRSQISNPHRFISSPTHLYFIARSPGDNSYQLFVSEKDELTSISKTSATEPALKITPNPSSNFISVGSDAELLTIFDSSGNHIKSVINYKQHHQIDISKYKEGLYIIESIIGSKRIQNKFIKH